MGLLCLFPICTQTLIMAMKFCFLLGKMKKYTCLSRGKIASINLHLLQLAIRSTSNRNVHDVVKVSICQTSLRLSFPFLSCHSAAIFNHEITYSPHPPIALKSLFPCYKSLFTCSTTTLHQPQGGWVLSSLRSSLDSAVGCRISTMKYLLYTCAIAWPC